MLVRENSLELRRRMSLKLLGEKAAHVVGYSRHCISEPRYGLRLKRAANCNRRSQRSITGMDRHDAIREKTINYITGLRPDLQNNDHDWSCGRRRWARVRG